jgi:hypothetical protein
MMTLVMGGEATGKVEEVVAALLVRVAAAFCAK